MITITNILAATMLMFMIGCEKEEKEVSATEEQTEETAAEEEAEATMRYH